MKFLMSIRSIISLCRLLTRLFRILVAEGSRVGCLARERVLLARGWIEEVSILRFRLSESCRIGTDWPRLLSYD